MAIEAVFAHERAATGSDWRALLTYLPSRSTTPSNQPSRPPASLRARAGRVRLRIHRFFVAPSVLMLVLLLALPITQALVRRTDAGGMKNYIRALRDDHLARLAMRHTFTFAFFSVVGQYIFGFTAAPPERTATVSASLGALSPALDVPGGRPRHHLALDI